MTKSKNPTDSNSDTIIKKPHYVPPVGLALGSGMARGFAHIGVMKALKRHNIEPTIIAGTSIGAVVGGSYLADKLDELEQWALSLNRRNIFAYMDFRGRNASMIGGKKLENVLVEHFGDLKIEDLPHPFVAIATDLVTGQEVWLRRGSFVDAIRASFSLPGVFPPVELNRRTLIDGALVNPVPVSVCQALSSRMTIAVDLNADLIGKAAKPGESYQTIAGFDILDENFDDSEDGRFFKGGFSKRMFKRDVNKPSLFGVMVSSLNIIQGRLTRSRLAGDPPDVHIKPRVGHIGLLEFEKAEEIIHEGEIAVEAALPEIRAAQEVLLSRLEDEDLVLEK